MKKHIEGTKYDKDKIRWHLLPLESIKEIIKVLMYGSVKYEKDNWKKVSEAKERYYSACMRHITEWFRGEKYDSESGLSHLAHAGCCIIFLLWLEIKGKFN